VRADRDAATAPSSTIALVNGANARSGVLLVYFDSLGYWGTVCNDDFDTQAAQVACRQLGLGTPEGWQSLSKPASAPPGTPIVLDEFICWGTELSLQACPRRYGQPPTHNCDHSEDIYLTCTRDGTPLASPRLRRGNSHWGYRGAPLARWGSLGSSFSTTPPPASGGDTGSDSTSAPGGAGH